MDTKANEVDVVTLNDNTEHALVFQIRKDGKGGMDTVQCRRSKLGKETKELEWNSTRAKEIMSDIVSRYEPLVRDWVVNQFKGQAIKVSEANGMLRFSFKDRNVRVWLNYSAEGALSVSISDFKPGWKVRHSSSSGGKSQAAITILDFTDDSAPAPEDQETSGQIEG